MPKDNNPYSFSSLMGFVSDNFVVIVLVALFFFAGAFTGATWKENKMLKSGTAGTAGSPTLAGNPTDPLAPTGPTEAQLAALPEVSNDDYLRGDADADIILVEYSDYECPFCQRFHPTMLEVMENYGDQVAWVYRHFPLSFHPNAQRAAEAAECVGKVAGSDAFWTYSDAVFEKNGELGGSLTPAAIDEAIAEATANTQAVTECLNSGEMTAKVNAQMNAAQEAGVSGTPGTFVVTRDGAQELIGGALPYAQIEAIIDQYL